jgi:hypothetical protein
MNINKLKLLRKRGSLARMKLGLRQIKSKYSKTEVSVMTAFLVTYLQQLTWPQTLLNHHAKPSSGPVTGGTRWLY